jgi:hypothetical protein
MSSYIVPIIFVKDSEEVLKEQLLNNRTAPTTNKLIIHNI